MALSIATGFERSGVLRRLRVTPLGQRRLIGAKIAGVLVTEAIQVVVLALVALALSLAPARWRRGGGLEVAAALLLGSAGCAGIGLALAGRLRAEVNLAASNGLYLVLLLLSGIVVPLTSLPSLVRHVVIALPSGAMAEAMHRVARSRTRTDGRRLAVARAVGAFAPLLAARTFRFD